MIPMQDKFVQSLRYKLQKRVRRLNSADHEHFPYLLNVFFKFLEAMPLLAGIRDELLVKGNAKDLGDSWDRIMGGRECSVIRKRSARPSAT